MQDVEEESVGAKKPAPARAATGSKRSRAAEVHNLSERVSKTIPVSFSQNTIWFIFYVTSICFHLTSTNRGEGIGSMRRCEPCKNSYQTAIRLKIKFTFIFCSDFSPCSYEMRFVVQSRN